MSSRPSCKFTGFGYDQQLIYLQDDAFSLFLPQLQPWADLCYTGTVIDEKDRILERLLARDKASKVNSFQH